MNSKILFVVAFVCGVILGAIAQSGSAKNQPSPQWNEPEETVRQQMAAFQTRLDILEQRRTSDTIDALSKDIEAQVGIENILIQYREGQQAKWGTAATLTVGVLGFMGGVLGSYLTWYLTKRSKGVTQA